MKRKFREIALLMVPVVAVAAIVPGARTFGNWREANKVPRIESFVLRAPTGWEASRGATVGYTARTVVPDNGGLAPSNFATRGASIGKAMRPPGIKWRWRAITGVGATRTTRATRIIKVAILWNFTAV